MQAQQVPKWDFSPRPTWIAGSSGRRPVSRDPGALDLRLSASCNEWLDRDVAALVCKDNEGRPNKLTIIEFKKPGAHIFEKNKALAQCRLCASELVERIATVREVFAFLIVEIDDESYKDMKRTGFKDVFSLSERVFYDDFVIGVSDDTPPYADGLLSFSRPANCSNSWREKTKSARVRLCQLA